MTLCRHIGFNSHTGWCSKKLIQPYRVVQKKAYTAIQGGAENQSIGHREKMPLHSCVALCQMLTNFQQSFTIRYSSKFVIKSSLNKPHGKIFSTFPTNSGQWSGVFGGILYIHTICKSTDRVCWTAWRPSAALRGWCRWPDALGDSRRER